MMNNKAAWLPAAHAQLEVREAPDAELGEHDVLIESKAVAINPGDSVFRASAGLSGADSLGS